MYLNISKHIPHLRISKPLLRRLSKIQRKYLDIQYKQVHIRNFERVTLNYRIQTIITSNNIIRVKSSG